MTTAIDHLADLSLTLAEKYKNYDAISRGKREWEETFDAVSDLILIVDTDHTISRVNRAMALRCGLTPQELPGRKCYEVFHNTSEPPDFCPFVALMQDGRERTVEIEEKTLGGFFDVTVFPLFEGNSLVACVHVARDITERKRLEAERLALEHKLLQAQKLESLGVLAGGIAHDFNNILMIILGHCMLAKLEVDEESWGKSRLSQIELAGNRASDLCRQLLAYVGRSPLVQTQIRLGVLVKEIAAILKGGTKRNVALEHDVEGDIPEILGDKAQIQQIIMNLIVNAVEAIGEKSGGVRVKLCGCAVREDAQETDFFGDAIPAGTYARLEVADTGCGMTEETQSRIFEPFFSTKFTGRGLGLSAMIGIVRSHKGALQLESTPGLGTTFRVYFPANTTTTTAGAAKDSTETPRPPEPSTAAKAWHESKECTVLLVDDEDEVRKVGVDLLTGMGYATITARNGREALEVYRDHSSCIDLILMDLTMPYMDGIEAYEEIRKESSTVPIVICSGYGKQEISSYICDDRHAGVIPKPYSRHRLEDILKRLLDKRPLPSDER